MVSGVAQDWYWEYEPVFTTHNKTYIMITPLYKLVCYKNVTVTCKLALELVSIISSNCKALCSVLLNKS